VGASKGGNLLLHVSPRGDGTLPPEQVGRLEAVAGWMDVHADAIHGTQAGLEPWQFYGPSTRRGDVIYLACPWRPYEDVVVRGVPIRRLSAKHHASGRELAIRTRATAEQELLSSDPVGEAFIEVPDELIEPHATVIELHLAP